MDNEPDIKKFKLIVKKLVKKHNIKITGRRRTARGEARVPERTIIIPYIHNVHNFLICIHEVGHIVNKWSYDKMSIHRSEFLTEKWTIQQARKYKLHTKHPRQYELYVRNAKRYVVNCCRENKKPIPYYVMKWVKAKPSIHEEL
jgi:hypothetical protein